MVIYINKTGGAISLSAAETCPGASYPDMFESREASQIGGYIHFNEILFLITFRESQLNQLDYHDYKGTQYFCL